MAMPSNEQLDVRFFVSKLVLVRLNDLKDLSLNLELPEL